jgi:hypothetical protein
MLSDYLLSNWDKMIGTEPPFLLQVVPISSCLFDYGNDVVLLFVDSHPYPDYVMKISRKSKYSFKLENELTSLKLLKTVKTVSRYIPYPCYIGRYDEYTFIIQGGLPGRSLFNIIRQKGIDALTYDLLNKSIDLLLLINSSKMSIHPPDLLCKEIFPDILARCDSDLLSFGLAKSVIEESREDSLFFNDMGNSYFLHGDYWQTNIMIDNNNICGVIDWEFSLPSSNIPSDIIWFLINLGHCIHLRLNPTANITESFYWSFFTEGEHSDLIRALYRKYIKGIGLQQDLFEVLLKMTLIKMSLRELVAYGKHTNMDFTCQEMLKHFIQNARKLCIS